MRERERAREIEREREMYNLCIFHLQVITDFCKKVNCFRRYVHFKEMSFLLYLCFTIYFSLSLFIFISMSLSHYLALFPPLSLYLQLSQTSGVHFFLLTRLMVSFSVCLSVSRNEKNNKKLYTLKIDYFLLVKLNTFSSPLY